MRHHDETRGQRQALPPVRQHSGYAGLPLWAALLGGGCGLQTQMGFGRGLRVHRQARQDQAEPRDGLLGSAAPQPERVLRLHPAVHQAAARLVPREDRSVLGLRGQEGVLLRR